MEDKNASSEFMYSPRSLEEFVEFELEKAKDDFEIHEGNLELIKQGNEDLTDIYGGVEGAQKLLSCSSELLRKSEAAKRALQERDKQPARELLEERLSELRRVVNENIRLGNNMAKDFVKEICVLLPLRDEK